MSAGAFDGEWVETPPKRRRKGPHVWEDRCAVLRARPGSWAKFGPYSFDSTRRQVLHIRNGRYGDGFDARRDDENGSDWIYVCFVGQPSLEVVRDAS